MLLEALRWRKLKVSVIPIKPNSKHFDTIAMRNRGYVLADLREKLPTEDDLIYWFKDGDRRMAVITNGMAVVDFDSEETFFIFQDYFPEICCTMTIRSPRGYHCYYVVKNEAKDRVRVVWNHTEVKHSGMAIISAGDSYKPVDNRLLNIFSMLKIRDIFALPMIKEVETLGKEKSSDNGDFLFTECNSSSPNPILRIKSSLPISKYLQSRGNELTLSGDDFYLTNCPFHLDINPSFWINDRDKLCNCFKPDCMQFKPMDILNLYQKLNHCTLGKAISQLAGSLGF